MSQVKIVGPYYFYDDRMGLCISPSTQAMDNPVPLFNMDRRKLYVDVDGVLFTAPFKDIYTFEGPNEEVIAKIRERRAAGDMIIIWTTRTNWIVNRMMNPSDLSKGALIEILASNLKKYDIPYDGIEVIDKPLYHAFVDDKAMNVEGFLQS